MEAERERYPDRIMPRTCELDQREMSERTRRMGGEERLTFDPGRPISPWRRTNEGRGDVALIRAERNTRTQAQILL